MAWHPRLVVRFGKGRGISSPTGSTGYVFNGVMALVLAAAIVTVAVKEQPLVLLALAIPGVFLRDAWAWFAATGEERASFRDEIERLKSLGRGSPPDQAFNGADGGWWAVAKLLVCLALSIIALVVFGHPAFLVAALYLTAFLVCTLLDRLRARTHKRLYGRPQTPLEP